MNTQTRSNSPDIYSILSQTQRLRVSDGEIKPVLDGCTHTSKLLVLIWSQLGDFDNLEYAWWLVKDKEQIEARGITIRAIGIGNRNSGIKFCEYTGFPQEWLFVDAKAEIHRLLGLYRGLTIQFPMLTSSQNAWLNLMLMCAGIGSPGTLKEVFRGYKGDYNAPQLIADEEVVKGTSLPPIKGAFFKAVGGKGFQRPFELATLRLRNMTEVLSNWKIYVPDSSCLTQRGGTFLFDSQGQLIYSHRDRKIY
ncbi:AhpC/TSA family protein [Nostoc sp. CHAB 5784]|uniref:peroxiredoxin-like family protein n=1 Tax=Nostoc mirabile TaxID=2907820 RepID=UPI001E4F444B|nr:peroxiredoxin-like family protein [Nostoc mirabile]MCC5670386.1 AhpC/TSA family protein [Nostoc mirabile CHAB5784]